ncbi:MAG: hypothetical protein AVDCRST_MAG20-2129, partial [uncultured Acidimicrobiales bacterium]
DLRPGGRRGAVREPVPAARRHHGVAAVGGPARGRERGVVGHGARRQRVPPPPSTTSPASTWRSADRRPGCWELDAPSGLLDVDDAFLALLSARRPRRVAPV